MSRTPQDQAEGGLESRFWAKVHRTDGCWLWTAAKSAYGYGVISARSEDGTKRVAAAHRLSYEAFNGPIPTGAFVGHRCDVPACVRPDHLYLRYERGDLRAYADASTRFWEKVRKGDGCWEWQATRSPKGYGKFCPKKGTTMQAHRWAFEEARGAIPDGLLVCHHCDNPRCVRPDHLFLGTNHDNMQDAMRKGRLSEGPRRRRTRRRAA